MPKPPDFVDRKEEIKLFKKMLAGKTDERILTLLIPADNGKTYLINYLHGHCQHEQIPVTLIDFDYRQREIISFWKFTYRICDQFGWDYFENVKRFEDKNHDFFPLIQIQPESGHGGINFGNKGQYQEADFDSITGRDQIHFQMGDISYHEAQGISATRQEKLMHDMGRALQNDLKNFCGENKAVILLDTFEWVSVETRKWVDEWIFSHLADCYPNLYIVLAGRPEHGFPEYVYLSRPWRALMRIRQQFSKLQEDDVRKFIELSNIPSEGDELFKHFLIAAEYQISLLAIFRDMYRS